MAYQPLRDLVRLGNIIHLTGDGAQPFKGEVAAGDLPELLIIPAGGDLNAPNVGSSSSGWAVRQRYTVAIATDQFRTNQTRSINPIRWAVIRALARLEDTLPGYSDVRWSRVSEWSDAIGGRGTDPQALTEGWHTVLTIEVRIIVPIQEIKA